MTKNNFLDPLTNEIKCGILNIVMYPKQMNKKEDSNGLSQLDPKKVYEELDGKILLCYEKETDFCHRFLVASWLEFNLGIEVKEI